MHIAWASKIGQLAAGIVLAAGLMRAAAPEACTLLSAEAIRQVTGEQVANTKATSQTAGKIRQSQCFYALPTFTDSISVTLTSPAGMSRDAARELWERWFHRGEADRDRDRGKAETGEEEEAAKPAPIAGIGDEAYWVHSFVGNLYVRKGNRFLRISLGGKMSDEERQSRARALAAAALRGLP